MKTWVGFGFFFLLFFLLHPLKSIPDKHLGIKILAEGRALAQLKVRNLCFPSPWKSSSPEESKQSETSLIFQQLQTSQETRKKQLVLSTLTATSITEHLMTSPELLLLHSHLCEGFQPACSAQRGIILHQENQQLIALMSLPRASSS